MRVYSIRDEKLNKFGKLLTEKAEEQSRLQLVEKLKNFDVPKEMNTYSPSEVALEEVGGVFQKYFDEKIQIGYCNGRGDHLNSLEYHNTPEIDVFATKAIILLREFTNDDTILSDSVTAFMVEKVDAVLFYPKTWHFAPINIEKDGFKAAIILPKGTNLPLQNRKDFDPYFAQNKWLYAHKEHKKMVDNKAYIGIVGKNYGVDDLEY